MLGLKSMKYRINWIHIHYMWSIPWLIWENDNTSYLTFETTLWIVIVGFSPTLESWVSGMVSHGAQLTGLSVGLRWSLRWCRALCSCAVVQLWELKLCSCAVVGCELKGSFHSWGEMRERAGSLQPLIRHTTTPTPNRTNPFKCTQNVFDTSKMESHNSMKF